MQDPLTALRSIPSQSAAEMSRWAEYGWLERLDARLEAIKKELVEGYGKAGGDTNVESAISDLESCIDGLYRRRNTLDEGE